MEVSFFVPGKPQPGGSKKAFVINGRAILTEANKNSKPWRVSVGFAAAEVIKTPFEGPLEVRFDFYMPRPQGHFGTGKKAGVLKDSAPTYHISKPDTTKLIRSTEDALKGIAWHDDSQIAVQHGTKLYANSAVGARITITNMMTLDDL